MKFAIPLAEGKLTAHFGHCKEFAVIDVEDKHIVKKEILEPPPHEPGVLPKWLHGLGANVIIAGGMGQRAISLFDTIGLNDWNIRMIEANDVIGQIKDRYYRFDELPGIINSAKHKWRKLDETMSSAFESFAQRVFRYKANLNQESS